MANQQWPRREPAVDPLRQAWVDFFQSPAWEALAAWLGEQQASAQEETVNSQSWEGFRQAKGGLMMIQMVVDHMAERLEEATQKE